MHKAINIVDLYLLDLIDKINEVNGIKENSKNVIIKKCIKQ